MSSEKTIEFLEAKVRTLSNNSLLSLLCDFDIKIIESQDKSEEIVLSREQLIQMLLRQKLDWYSVSCQNCGYDEEIAATLLLDRWTDYWMFC